MANLALSEFADRMNKIMPQVIKEFARRQTNELYRGKITLPQFLILDSLDKKGECKMSELAQFMGVTTPAMTGIVNRLVKYAYTKRVFDPQDRRIIKIRLTPKGKELVKKINQERRKMIIDIFGKLSAVERENYLKTLMRVHNILTEEKESI